MIVQSSAIHWPLLNSYSYNAEDITDPSKIFQYNNRNSVFNEVDLNDWSNTQIMHKIHENFQKRY